MDVEDYWHWHGVAVDWSGAPGGNEEE